MIQRIQTLYLLAATALVALMLFLPLTTFVCGSEEVVLKAFGASLGTEGSANLPLYLGILLATATALPFVTIFLYKRRVLQIRLGGVELALLVGVMVFEVIYIYLTNASLTEWYTNLEQSVDINLGVAAFLPIVAIVFVTLAMRATLRDELLVRSLNRIR